MLIAVVLSAIAGSAAAQTVDAQRELRVEVVARHAAWCHQIYGECERKARGLQQAIAELLAKPGADTLAAARQAWIEGRRIYGMTEVLRFCDGPIEPLEPLLNAWPIDEAYIDSVQGQPDAGIIHDTKGFPNLSATVLELANERGGETQVSVGWHAIEFLLWGQDLATDGPGDRPVSDFVVGPGRDAARRGEYLTAISALLVRHFGQLQSAWAPDAANYRATFVADPEAAVRKMLTGVAVLSSFEMTGERLGVAYETQDQEQEHSCFSDTTHLDFEANQVGIQTVVLGPDGGPGLLALIAAAEPTLAKGLEQKLADALTRLRAIPQPFDAAMRGPDTAPGRVAIAAAIAALDEQTELITIAGHMLGHELPLKPGG